MPKILANGINIHYWRVGEGPDIVMLHGLSGNLAVWHLKMLPILRREYRVTTYDLRGHGRTDLAPTGYTTGDMVADLEGLLDALDMEQVHLVGHSYGADISLHFGLLHPHRVGKMVLLEASVPALVNLRKNEDWEGWRYWAEALEEFAGVKVPREKWTDIDYMLRQSLKAPIIFGPSKGLPRKGDKLLKLLDTTTMVQDYEVVGELTLENLPKIPHPKLLIYDSGSPYMGVYRTIRDLLTNCTPVLLPPSDHRHFSPLEEPELLVEYIKVFLQSGRVHDPTVPEDKSE
ncbi:MAG: alpha/beta hydrolase [Anaerolineales bacterium]|nr:alpha/beta hydrolase [Anaerolineales bacterium]